MDKSYVDISVLNKKVDFFIEPFEWINPQKIIGFSKSDVRKENIRLYEENEYESDNPDTPDIIIASYLQECLLFYPKGYLIFLEYGLWLITELYSSYVVYSFPVDIRENILRDSHEINYIFNKIYDEFIIKDEKEDYHCANLLKIFIFENFQFGKEWGTFDIKHINHDSILSKNILIDNSNNQNVFLCSYLNNENLIKLSNLVDYNKGKIPQYKYWNN